MLFEDKYKFSRGDRLASQLKKIISDIIRNRIKELSDVMVTVTNVRLTKDCKLAYVYVSSLSSNISEISEMLNKHKQVFVSGINSKLKLKYIPKLEFFSDDSFEYEDRINEILKKEKEKNEMMKNQGIVLNDETEEKFRKIFLKISESENIFITSHQRPDGDSLGSMIAMYNFIVNLPEKNVRMAAEGGCPHTMKWMPDTDFIENNPDKLEMFNPDLIICLDCEFNERTGYIYKIFKDRIDSETQIAVIDHHKGTSGIGNMRIVIPEAASTTEIIYNFFKINGIEINNKTALSMYVGILTDTYMFCQANTSSSVLKAASELITFSSVDPYALTQKLFENKTYEQSKLLARFLENIIIDTDNAIGYSYLENKDFDETGTEHDDTEGFINYIRAIKNVKIALFFKEISADFIKVNIRTVGDIDILPYVKKYGGGGHKNAAGFEIKDKLTPELITEYLDSLKKEIVK